MALGLIAGTVAGPVLATGTPVDGSTRPVVRPTVPLTQIRPAARPQQAPTPQIQVAASNARFKQWIKAFRGRALARGISGNVFDRAFRGVKYDPAIIAKDRHQSEFTKQIWDYLDSAASPVRVKNGQAALRKYRRTLEQIEARYGVEKEVVAAIWGVESAYGAQRGDVDIIQALATLAFDGRRGKFFEAQLIAALKIIQSGDVRPRGMKGSWAGAMGHTQFIPTSYLAYAQDFNGDGKRDIWSDDPTDALASTASYLAKFGWQKGQPWGVEVVLPKGFNFGLANRKILKTPSEWGALGVRAASGKPVPNYGRASILLPAGSRGAAFMIFNNFAVIEKYNKADAYVIGVGHLSDRL
ncbi:MAG TPA: lytic murein transglycosylase, partial [Rhodobacteraceae bacterium]|nr:lytic murein transglycosylase [Paracoccaceae bacterium]